MPRGTLGIEIDATRNRAIKDQESKTCEVIVLVTGTLAEPATRRVAKELRASGRYAPHVVTLNIQVAALMTTEWVGRKLTLPDLPRESIGRVMLPGYCRGEVDALASQFGVSFERGPVNVHDLPDYLSRARRGIDEGFGAYDIEIVAEINECPRLSRGEIVSEAEALLRDGADVIDVGCDPTPGIGSSADRSMWADVGDTVRALRDIGARVSVDSFHPDEVAAAVQAGAALVLSVNSGNRERASEWGVEVVAIPDTPDDLPSLDATVEQLDKAGVKFRIDPILEPVGFGFAKSVTRYVEARRRWPNAQMMMGVGNLSEMTEVDSAGVNMMLIGCCQELNIRSVLTTQVINWARSSVREIDLARRVVHHALKHGSPPKHIDDRLVMLRDPKLREPTRDELNKLAAELTDRNVRLFVAKDAIHAMRNGVYVEGEDPFELFKELGIDDASHAFYLGYEMAKAVTAMTLGKNYVQDEPLRWGMLTRDEVSHHGRERRSESTEENR